MKKLIFTFLLLFAPATIITDKSIQELLDSALSEKDRIELHSEADSDSPLRPSSARIR